MKAIVLNKIGGIGNLELEEVVTPTPKSGEILVRNHCTGVNYIDIYQRTGLYPISTPAILGREGAGVVEEVGPDVKDFKKGDRVAYIGPSTYAEYTSISINYAIILPQEIPFEEGVALMIQGLTAAYLTHDSYPVQRDDWVLVPAAAGGTGGMICQMAKERGGRVIGLVSSEEKAKRARDQGADHVINYKTTPDWDKEVLKITGGLGVAVAYDGVGASTYQKGLACMAKRGTFISFGNASGTATDVNTFDLTSKCLKLMRPALFSYVETRKEFLNLAELVINLYQRGKLKVEIYKLYPLKDVGHAQDDLEHRRTMGKLVIKID